MANLRVISLHERETGKLCNKSMLLSRVSWINGFVFVFRERVEIVFFFLTVVYSASYFYAIPYANYQ